MVKPRGRGHPEKASVKKILNAIQGTGGVINIIAQKLGVHYHTVLNYEKKYESVRVAIQEEQDKILDKAEDNLFTRIQEGDEDTSKWFLARRGRHRGYSEKIDIEEKGEKKIIIEVQYAGDSEGEAEGEEENK